MERLFEEKKTSAARLHAPEPCGHCYASSKTGNSTARQGSPLQTTAVWALRQIGWASGSVRRLEARD